MALITNIRIVLVEPAGALNVGSVARVMKNMGLHHLVVVNPRCDLGSLDAKQMAVHAGDVLSSAEQVASLAQALQGCQRIIATLGRDRAFPMPLESPRVALPWLLLGSGQNALVFGREDRGLTNDELKYAQRLVQIPTDPAYPSLNLAQSVAICCYELAIHHHALAHEAQDLSSTSYSELRNRQDRLPPLESLERFYQDLQTLLLEIGYLHPHTTTSRMEKFRWLLARSSPSEQELAMLRGIIRQVRWALQQQHH